MLVIRNWRALPYAFKGLAEGKPPVEVLNDPTPIHGLPFLDDRVEKAVKEGKRVLVYRNLDAQPVECPPELVDRIPKEAWKQLFR